MGETDVDGVVQKLWSNYAWRVNGLSARAQQFVDNVAVFPYLESMRRERNPPPGFLTAVADPQVWLSSLFGVLGD